MAKKKLSRMRAPRSVAPVLKAKRRPRGKPFARGNKIGIGSRFQPGQSGNAGGRPKSKEVSRASREWLAGEVTLQELNRHKLPREWLGCTRAEVLALIRGQSALGGSLPDAVELTDRAEGKPRTSLSINEQANPLEELIRSTNALSARIGGPEQPYLLPDEPQRLLEAPEQSVPDAEDVESENEPMMYGIEVIEQEEN